MLKPYECTQCGSTDFEDINLKQVRCVYCGSLFRLTRNEPTLYINNGANVVFGKNANVEVRGDIEIERGANVDIQGKVTVFEGKNQKEFSLKLIKDNNG
ncbi:MAG: hypothetical protein C0410_10320 [Anaerolinea sp.]|nr:hypothetical protein [Anaerolinea sp.]